VDLRSRLSGVSNCLANLYIFLTIKSFPTVQMLFTPHGAYWFYASVGRDSLFYEIVQYTQYNTL